MATTARTDLTFAFKPVDAPSAEPEDLGPLAHLVGQDGTGKWEGKGFNTIWRPHPVAEGGGQDPRPRLPRPELTLSPAAKPDHRSKGAGTRNKALRDVMTIMVATPCLLLIGLGGTAAGKSSNGTVPPGENPVAHRTATVAEGLKECPVKTNTANRGPAISPPIPLSPTPQSAEKQVNLDTNRAPVIVKHVTVTGSRPLPASFASPQINFDAVLSRTGNTLETAEFPDPTFSVAHISNDRRSISFSICLNPAGVHAGKYVGTVTVGGPEGLGAAVIALTVNAKASEVGYWVFAALAAFFLIVIKDSARVKKEYEQKTKTFKWWRNVWWPMFRDPIWDATTLVSLGLVGAALWKIYTADPAWGADGLGSLIAFVGAAAAAVGGHSIISALSPSPTAN